MPGMYFVARENYVGFLISYSVGEELTFIAAAAALQCLDRRVSGNTKWMQHAQGNGDRR